MTGKLSELARETEPYVLKLREELHRIPELRFEEEQTLAVVRREVDASAAREPAEAEDRDAGVPGRAGRRPHRGCGGGAVAPARRRGRAAGSRADRPSLCLDPPGPHARVRPRRPYRDAARRVLPAGRAGDPDPEPPVRVAAGRGEPGHRIGRRDARAGRRLRGREPRLRAARRRQPQERGVPLAERRAHGELGSPAGPDHVPGRPRRAAPPRVERRGHRRRRVRRAPGLRASDPRAAGADLARAGDRAGRHRQQRPAGHRGALVRGAELPRRRATTGVREGARPGDRARSCAATPMRPSR